MHPISGKNHDVGALMVSILRHTLLPTRRNVYFSLPQRKRLRTERDSNPRYTFAYAPLAEVCLKPLGHPSVCRAYHRDRHDIDCQEL